MQRLYALLQILGPKALEIGFYRHSMCVPYYYQCQEVVPDWQRVPNDNAEYLLLAGIMQY